MYYSSFIQILSRSNATSSRDASVQDTGVRQINNHLSSSFDMAIIEEEPLPRIASEHVVAIHQQEPAADSNEISIDIERGAVLPPGNDFEQSEPYDDMPMQIDSPESSHHHSGSNAADVIIGDSKHPQAVDSTPTFKPASALNSAPRRRVADRDLHPLEIDNTIATPFNNEDRILIDRSRQGRRPHQRALVPKTSPVQSPKTTSTLISSKSTPDSARTDLSFASTATQATLSGSSAIATPSLAVESPVTPYTPSESQLVCRDCGQVFNTPGQQKYVFSFRTSSASPQYRNNIVPILITSFRKHHNRQHKLRYVCDICVRPFGVRADLERHEHTVHSDLFRSNKRFWCTVPGCKTPTQEWKRKDNFTRHVRSCEARAARVAGANGG